LKLLKKPRQNPHSNTTTTQASEKGLKGEWRGRMSAASPSGAAKAKYEFDCANWFDFATASPAQGHVAVDAWFGEWWVAV
jgi:hypothetical protein